jgi:hypothetical protein
MRHPKKYQRRILLLGVTLVLALIAIIVLLREGELRQVRAFSDHYARLHGEGDVDGILELFHWQDVPPHHRTRLHIALQAETRYPLARVEINRASAQSIDEAFKNTSITLNLAPRWRMETVLATEDRLGNAYWIGRTDTGEWKIAGAKGSDAFHLTAEHAERAEWELFQVQESKSTTDSQR